MNSPARSVDGPTHPTPLWRLGFVPVFVALALVCQVLREGRYGSPADTAGRVLYVRSGEVIERLALSFDGVLADVYWIQALQHFGGERLFAAEKEYAQLYPFLDIATTLDPHFSIAYQFGAHFLSEPPPGGPGRPDLAITLLQKGHHADPSRWEYLQEMGFVYYWWYRDYYAAADWFQRASVLPDAPTWLRPLAAAMLTHGGQRNDARFLWRTILETANHEWLRGSATRALGQIDAMEAMDRLAMRVRERTAGTGRPPTNWQEMIAAGLLSGVPLDPAGVPYELDPATGDVSVASASPLFPLPTPLAAASLPPS